MSVIAGTALALVLAAPASASKEIVNYLGSGNNGTAGGDFAVPGGVSVNTTGNGPADPGDVYVADAFNNRIQRFDSAGKFVSAWGANVIQAGKPGDLAGTNPFEICTVAADCKAGAATGGNGEASGNGSLSAPQSVAVDADTGNVYVSDRDNARVNVYDGEGKFIASYGFDVDATTAPTGYEVCPATDVCKGGVGGSGVGQVGSTSESRVLGIAVSPPDGNAATGTVFLADSANRRVDTYNLDGTSPGAFGSATVFGFGSGPSLLQPRKIAADSRGIVYASNSKDGGEIERYDSQNANGGGVAFLSPITAQVNEIQKIAFTGFTDGDHYKLRCPDGAETEPISYSSAFFSFGPLMEKALANKCGASSIAVSGSSPVATLVFGGADALANVPQTVCTPLSGTGGCTVSTVFDGHPGTLPEAGVLRSFDFIASPTATAGLAVAPDSDGGGADEDSLYVLRDPASGNTVVKQYGPVNDPGLSTAPVAADATHGSEAGLDFADDLGLDDSSGRLFISSESPRTRVYTLAEKASVSAPALAVDPASGVGETTATFSGTVDPKGGLVSCDFQYSTDMLSWTDVAEPGCGSLDTAGGAQVVSEDVTGLDPNTHYFVRLSASRPFMTGSTVTSATVRTFDTDAVPPVLSDVGAVQVADTSMRLVGTIDPRHSPTGYVFEYGTTPALGSSTSPLNIGAGTVSVTISRLVTGLDPDTTYYFRLVATSLVATTTSEGHSAHTRAEPLPLPEQRGYEMVSPPEKNQGSVNNAPLALEIAGFSRDGNAAAFCTTALFGEPTSQMTAYCAPYISRRTATGWQTSNPYPPYCEFDINDGDHYGQLTTFISPNFERAVLEFPESQACPTPPLDPAAPLPAKNLYLQDFTMDPVSFHLLAPNLEDANPSSGDSPGVFSGADDGFNHIVYESEVNQSVDAPTPEEPFSKIYEWHDGSLSLVSRDTDNEPFLTDSAMPYPDQVPAIDSSVSQDGNRIYFQNVVSGGTGGQCSTAACHLYLREGGITTIEVSASECTVSCGSNSSPEEFRWANPAGDVAFFASTDKLTNESSASGKKLYRWDRNAPPGNRLVDVTVDHEPADGTGSALGQVLGISDDGDTVYFTSAGKLVVGQPTAGGIYRWRFDGGNPTLDYLGPFSELEQSNPPSGGMEIYSADRNLDEQRSRVTPDGRYLVIWTRVQHDPAIDHDPYEDVYRWGEQEGWTCVSCQLPGTTPSGETNSSDIKLERLNSTIVDFEPIPSISDDGRRIFFDTPDALVPGDVNGESGCQPKLVQVSTVSTAVKGYSCQDVYEWNDGTLSLISSGTGASGSALIGATRAGNDVFFETGDRLVGWDTDNSVDIYDARAGGGFPEPPPQPPSCEGEGCRGAGTAAPAVTGAGSAVFEGPGNPTSGGEQSCPKGKRKVRRHGKTRCVGKKGPHKGRHRPAKRAAKRNRRVGR